MSITSGPVENIAKGWNRHPRAELVGVREPRVSAALWVCEEPGTHEVWPEPDPEHHVIILAAKQSKCDLWLENRLAFSRVIPQWACNIVPAGYRGHAAVESGGRALHIFMPTLLLRGLVEADATPTKASNLEIVDPDHRADPYLERLGQELVLELERPEYLSRLRIDALGQDLAIHLLRRWSNLSGMGVRHIGGCIPKAKDWRLRRAVEFLECQIDRDVSLSELAAAVGLSEGHLSALFRSGLGEPPHRWLVRQRVQRARGMLENPRLSITDIAHACGFVSSQHLATTFRKHTGTTPTAYRRGRLS